MEPCHLTIVDDGGKATPHPVIDCGALDRALRGDSDAAAAQIGRQMVSALVNRGYFFADADAVLPLALMRQTYAQMNAAHDDVPDDVKQAMEGHESSRLYWSSQGNEDEYEPGTKATAQHWSFSRTGQEGRLEPPEAGPMRGFDAFADGLYGAQDRLADAVMAGLAAGLKLPLDEFSQHVSLPLPRPAASLVPILCAWLSECEFVGAWATAPRRRPRHDTLHPLSSQRPRAGS